MGRTESIAALACAGPSGGEGFGLLGDFGVRHQALLHRFLLFAHAGGKEFLGEGGFGLAFLLAAEAQQQLTAHRADVVILGCVFFGRIEM